MTNKPFKAREVSYKVVRWNNHVWVTLERGTNKREMSKVLKVQRTRNPKIHHKLLRVVAETEEVEVV